MQPRDQLPLASKTPPDLSTKSTPQATYQLQPIHFASDMDVDNLLLDLHNSQLIKLRTNTEGDIIGISIPDEAEFVREFIVGADGQTYRRKQLAEIYSRGLEYHLNCDILTQNGSITLANYGVDNSKVVYNEVLAEMIKTLNPNKYGFLRIKAPTCNVERNKQIVFPVGFSTATVCERVNNIRGMINIAAQELIQLGYLQKMAIAAQSTDAIVIQNLQNERAKLNMRLNAIESKLESRINSLKESVQNAEAQVQQYTPAFNALILKKPKYQIISQQAIYDIESQKDRAIKNKNKGKYGMTVSALLILDFGVGLFPLPYTICKYFYWKNKVGSYTLVYNLRLAESIIARDNNELVRTETANNKLFADIAALRHPVSTQTVLSESRLSLFTQAIQTQTPSSENANLRVPAKGSPPYSPGT